MESEEAQDEGITEARKELRIAMEHLYVVEDFLKLKHEAAKIYVIAQMPGSTILFSLQGSHENPAGEKARALTDMRAG